MKGSRQETTAVAWRIALAVGVLALLALRLRDGTGNIVDDAYMTLRHARNVALGHGLVYDAGVPCLGTTTPLFALLHGAVGALVGAERVPWSAVLGNALADALAFLLLATWVSEAARSRVVGLGAAAYYAFAPRAIEYSSGAMEAPLFTLLVLVALREASRGREALSGLASGLALVCRPDGGLAGALALACLLGRGALARRVRVPWRFLASAAFVALPWVAYACAVYPWGPLPQSVVAKGHRPFFVEPGHALGILELQAAAAGAGRFVWIAGGFYTSVFRWRLVAPGALLNAVVCLVGARRLDGRGRLEGTLLLGFGLAYLALYAVGNPLMLGWYQVPLEAVAGALLVPGVATIVERLELRGPARPDARPYLTWAVVASLAWLQLFAALGLRDHATTYLLRERWDKKRERDYLACGKRLEAKAPPGAVVQASENGAVGWAWRGPVLDTVGLQTPGAERYYPLARAPRSGNMAVPAALVLDMRPDYFVTLEVFVRETCLEDPAFRAAYELDESLSDLSATTYRSRGLLVFRRR